MELTLILNQLFSLIPLKEMPVREPGSGRLPAVADLAFSGLILIKKFVKHFTALNYNFQVLYLNISFFFLYLTQLVCLVIRAKRAHF